MNVNKYFIIVPLILLLLVSACSTDGNSTFVSNKQEGIELALTLEKQEYTLNEDVIARVIITNHNQTPSEFYAPIPLDIEDGIAGVMIEQKNQSLWNFFMPQNSENISNIEGRSYYDLVHVQLAANETIEQEFLWEQELIDQKTQEQILAASGEYILSTFIIMDEINKNHEIFEPDKQLISKVNFSVK